MNHHMLNMIGAAILAGGMGAVSTAGAAGDGVVILQREVPPHPAYRESPPGNVVQMDVSPDDKVSQGVRTKELSDGDFAAVNSGLPQTMGRPAAQVQDLALSDNRFGSSGPNDGVGGSASSVQSMVPVVTGQVGPAVGAATNAAGAGIARTMGTFNGLTGAIQRTGGQ